jgi:hypothetical protein
VQNISAQPVNIGRWKDTISNDADFHNHLGFKISEFFAKDSSYRYHNPRPIMIFFDINDSGKLLHYYCIGQIKQRNVGFYRSLLDSALVRADPGYIRNCSKYTLLQTFLEIGDSVKQTPDTPDIEYGGYVIPQSNPPEYFDKRPIPLFGFNLMYNQGQLYSVQELTEKKPLKMMIPITIYLSEKRFATIYRIKREKKKKTD